MKKNYQAIRFSSSENYLVSLTSNPPCENYQQKHVAYKTGLHFRCVCVSMRIKQTLRKKILPCRLLYYIMT